MIKDLSRTAVDRYLKVVRTPFDAALGKREGERSSSLGLALDRADATARSVAGTALRDAGLKDDARLRREAADERERALRLRGVAEEHSATAEERVEEAKEKAEEQSREAAKAAERRKQDAKKRREETKKSAAKRTSKRKEDARKSATDAKKTTEKKTKRGKLSQLESKEKALDTKKAAVNAAAESKRLADATATAKTKRKAGS